MSLQNKSKVIINELKSVFNKIENDQVEQLKYAIKAAKNIVLIGVGREGLSTKSFTMRLMHIGKSAHWVWDETTPGIYEGDLLIAVNGSGNIGHINYVIEKAKLNKSDVFVITGDPSGEASKLANNYLFLPASVYLGKAEVVESIQPMGNLFEQSLWILFDLIIMELIEELNLTKDEIENRHRNLE